jgi:signal transduction histidine kinase
VKHLVVVLLWFSAVAAAAEPKRVLVIHSFGRDFAPYNGVASELRRELPRLLGGPVVFHEVSLDAERGGPPEDERPLVEYLKERSQNRGEPPDLVVAIANPSAVFSLRHRNELFPGRRLLVTGIDRRRLDKLSLRPLDGAVSVDLDFTGMARSVLRLQPEVTTLAMVLGTTPLEQYWAEQLERDLASVGSGLRVLPPGRLTLEEMRARVASLPPRSAVFYYMFAVGADGVQHENEQALAAIREASNAPVYGSFRNQLGSGIVGGSLVDAHRMGVASAEMAATMLGDPQAIVGHREVPSSSPEFDWRELRRWNIAESRLPPGAQVRFRPPSAWEEHRALALVIAAIVLFQAALITGLLFQRTRARRAEGEAAGLTGRLLTAHEDERRRLARELHDDLTQRLARLAIDAGRMERDGGPASDGASAMRNDLVKLSEDVHALSYRLHPSVLDDLGLVEALRAECGRVASHASLHVEVDAQDVPEALAPEASLCLFRVAQEALSNAARHARASAVTVLLSPQGNGLQLAVSDNGSGFATTGKRQRASLGLASMRERVRLLRGRLDIESTPGRGTTVVAWVPA